MFQTVSSNTTNLETYVFILDLIHEIIENSIEIFLQNWLKTAQTKK